MGIKAKFISNEELAENYLALYREFEVLQLFRKAEDALLVALEKLPNHPALLSQLVRLYIKLEMPGKALSTANKLIKNHPDLAEGYRLRGEIHEMNGQYKNAIRDYRRSLMHTTADIPLVERLVTLLINYGQLREALEVIHSYQVVLRNPILLFEFQAEAHLRLGNQTAAFNKMREALIRQRDNCALLKRYLQLAILPGKKDPADIYQILRTSIPHLAQLPPEDLDELQIAFYRQKQNFEAALDIVERNLEADPENRRGRKLRAMIYLDMGKLSEGIQLLRGLFVQDPADREVLAPLENYYLMQNRMDEWKQLVHQVLQQQEDPFGLFGYLRQIGSNPDWLKISDVTYERFIEQVERCELPDASIRDITFQKLPVYALELFICRVAIDGRLPSPEQLWRYICQLRDKKQLITPFQLEDVQAAYPVWIFALHIYFLFKERSSFPVAFIPRLLQDENIAVQVFLEKGALEIDLSLLIDPARPRLKTFVKSKQGLRWRWPPGLKTPETTAGGMQFFSPKQFRGILRNLLKQLRKKYPQYLPEKNSAD